jgi:hypothetical protein
MVYKGYIYNTKLILNYENLTIKRKIRFWLMLPVWYLTKIGIQNKYKNYLK